MSKHSYEDTLIVIAVLEKDGKTPKDSHQYRVGKIGKIQNLNVSTPMFFEYSDGHGTLMTSNVENFEETNNGVTVTTRNAIYQLKDFNE